MLYATPEQVTQYTGIVLDADEAQRTIRNASNALQLLLRSAVYATDDEGAPAEQAVKDLFAEACSYLIEFYNATGDPAGVAGNYSGGSIGSVTLPSTVAGRDPAVASRYGAKTVELLMSSPLIEWGVQWY